MEPGTNGFFFGLPVFVKVLLVEVGPVGAGVAVGLLLDFFLEAEHVLHFVEHDPL